MSMRLESPDSASIDYIWRQLGALGLVLILLLGSIYAPVFPGLFSDLWNDPNYSHGFLVPLFSGYLVRQNWDQLKRLPLQGSWLGQGVLCLGIGTLVFGDIGAEDFLTKSSVICIIAGLVFSIWEHGCFEPSCFH